jgi:hypothetical protein
MQLAYPVPVNGNSLFGGKIFLKASLALAEESSFNQLQKANESCTLVL